MKMPMYKCKCVSAMLTRPLLQYFVTTVNAWIASKGLGYQTWRVIKHRLSGPTKRRGGLGRLCVNWDVFVLERLAKNSALWSVPFIAIHNHIEQGMQRRSQPGLFYWIVRECYTRQVWVFCVSILPTSRAIKGLLGMFRRNFAYELRMSVLGEAIGLPRWLLPV